MVYCKIKYKFINIYAENIYYYSGLGNEKTIITTI